MSFYTPISEIPVMYESLQKKFSSFSTRPIAWRRHQLFQLARFVKENADQIAECLYLDLGKPKQEVFMSEVGASIGRVLHAAQNVEQWTELEYINTSQPWQQSWHPRVEKHPKGVVLIISPWNLPLFLTLLPLCGAIAAGCCALVKPSELTPNVSSFIAKKLTEYLDSDAYKFVLGGIQETTTILEFKWDHISYTGNSRVARIISIAAAKHLTPLTLELGGKSPALIDSTADISISATRILWSKVSNAGQTCVAADYALIEKSILPCFLEALKGAYLSFFPNEGGAMKSESYGRIVSDLHFERLINILGRTNGQVVFGGSWDKEPGQRRIEPTIVVDVKPGDALLQEEIFGPILPVVVVEDVNEAVAFLKTRDHPLVLYIFSNCEENKKKIIANTVSGGVVINDTIMHTSIEELPFGGVGESGYGRVFGRHSFDNFVYRRSVIDVPYCDEPVLAGRYPPYTKQSCDDSRAMADVPIPRV